MSLYKNNPVTKDELILWEKNKFINPRTNRKIKESSPIYKYLLEQNKKFKNNEEMNILQESITSDEDEDESPNYLDLVSNVNGPAKGNHLLSFDNRDPISQDTIWYIEIDQKKISDDIPDYKLFSYFDKKNIICFNIESIQYMIKNNHFNHPITNDLISNDIIDRGKKMISILEENNLIDKIEESNELSDEYIKNYSFSIFQKFNLISIFIDNNWFLELDTSELLKLSYELKDFYENNTTIENRIEMMPEGKIGFEYSREKLEEITDNNKLKIQKYLLDNINYVISTTENESLKILGHYIMIGGLAVVCKEIRERYPDFIYGFSF